MEPWRFPRLLCHREKRHNQKRWGWEQWRRNGQKHFICPTFGSAHERRTTQADADCANAAERREILCITSDTSHQRIFATRISHWTTATLNCCASTATTKSIPKSKISGIGLTGTETLSPRFPAKKNPARKPAIGPEFSSAGARTTGAA